MALEYSTVRINITTIAADGIDVDDIPDDTPLTGSLELTPMIAAGSAIQYDDGGTLKLKTVSPITVDIGVTGDISHQGRDYVKVLAPTASTTNLAQLQWRASFKNLRYGSQVITMQPIYFYATPGAEINLADNVNVAPSSLAVQLSRGPRGFGIGEIVTDVATDELVFKLDDDSATEVGRVEIPASDVSDEAVASLVGSGEATKAALDGTYATAAAQAQRFLSKLNRGVENSVAALIGDSTANETTEHAYLEFAALAARFPAVTFIYLLVNPTTGVYDNAPVTVQTGTGTATCTLYNCSISGSRPGYVLGSRYAAAIAAIPDPDLVMISHGHNLADPTAENGRMGVRGHYLALTEAVSQEFPKAGIILESQNPSGIAGRETWQAIKAGIVQQIAAQRGYGFIDVHQAFVKYMAEHSVTLTALLLNDGTDTHPNATGSQIWADEVGKALVYSPTNLAPGQNSSSLSQVAESLIEDPSFEDWSGSLPAGWTASNATVEKDFTNFETGTYSLKVTSSATNASSYAELLVDPATLGIKGKVSGKVVTFAARMFAPAANTGSPSVMLRDQTESTSQRQTDMDSSSRDGWVWVICTKRLTSPTTSIRVRLHSKTSGVTTGSVSIDRVAFAVGDLPRAAVSPKKVTTVNSIAFNETYTPLLDQLSTLGAGIPAGIVTGVDQTFTNAGTGSAVLIVPPRNYVVKYLDWRTGTVSAGNYDIGILDATGHVLWSKGGAAFPAVSTDVTEDLSATPLTLTAGTPYWVVIVGDSATANVRGLSAPTAAFNRLANGTYRCRGVAGAYPLGAPGTVKTLGSTGGVRTPIIMLREA